MYHFIFQNSKHRESTGWRNRYTPIQMATNAGEIDRRLLNKSLKEYTITGCGQHEIQAALAGVGIRDLFHGHVLTVETKKQAMWVKLNFDVVTRKGGLRFTELYLDLTPELIRTESARWRELSVEEQQMGSLMNQCKYVVRNVQDGVTKVVGNERYSDATQQNMRAALTSVNAEYDKFVQQHQQLVKAKEQETARLRAVVEKHAVGGTP